MSTLEKLINALKVNPVDVRYEDIKRILENYGYALINSSGSHFRFKKENCPSLTIVAHNNKVKKWYVKDILKYLNL